MTGVNSGTIENSRSSAAVIGGDNSYVGGLAGENFGAIQNSFETGRITLHNYGQGGNFVGGLVGYNSGTIEGSFATGSMVAAGMYNAGSLTGSNSGTILNSYAIGSISGKYPEGEYFGGLIGGNSGLVTTFYSTGAAAGAKYIGGLIGGDFSAGGSLSDTYWDTDTSGITNLSQGAGNIANDPGITGLTTAQFQSGLPAGFDPNIWAEDSNINNGFPYLIANPPPK